MKEKTNKKPLNHHLLSVRCRVCNIPLVFDTKNPDSPADDPFGGFLQADNLGISTPFCGDCFPTAQLFAVQGRRLNPAVLLRAFDLHLYEREAPEHLGGLWARFDAEERRSRASFAELPTAAQEVRPYELFGGEMLRLLPGATGRAHEGLNEVAVSYDCIVMRYGRSQREREGITVH